RCATEVTVLEDTDAGWAGRCEGLRLVHVGAGETCQSKCKETPLCGVWATNESTSNASMCWHGLAGLHCESTEVPPPARAQRLMHGSYRELINTMGMQVMNLENAFGVLGNATEETQKCRMVCLSSLLCQHWQYSTHDGCWVEVPTRQLTGYPLVTNPRVINLGSEEAKSVISKKTSSTRAPTGRCRWRAQSRASASNRRTRPPRCRPSSRWGSRSPRAAPGSRSGCTRPPRWPSRWVGLPSPARCSAAGGRRRGAPGRSRGARRAPTMHLRHRGWLRTRTECPPAQARPGHRASRPPRPSAAGRPGGLRGARRPPRATRRRAIPRTSRRCARAHRLSEASVPTTAATPLYSQTSPPRAADGWLPPGSKYSGFGV
ncbi:unnamed protein product, partial [Prorocentrum cordatum]